MKRSGNDVIRGLMLTIIVFAVLFACVIALFNYMNTASESTQLDMVEEAVRNAAVTCYAVEGAYPLDIQYLVDNYGLYYDGSRYFVFYDAFASNIVPEIRVSLKGGAAHE